VEIRNRISAIFHHGEGKINGKNGTDSLFKDFDDFEAKICGVIESVISKDKTVIFRSIENMIERIMHLTYNPAITVLIIKNREELLQLYSSLNALRRAEMLLILPDRDTETIKLGYQLKPRFSTCLHNDFGVIKTVLKQMLLSLLSPDKLNETYRKQRIILANDRY